MKDATDYLQALRAVRRIGGWIIVPYCQYPLGIIYLDIPDVNVMNFSAVEPVVADKDIFRGPAGKFLIPFAVRVLNFIDPSIVIPA